MDKEKPPVLSDEEVIQWIKERTHWGRNTIATLTPEDTREIQRDAEVEWYEKEEQELIDSFTATMRDMVKQNRIDLEQARQKTVREIFEEIDRIFYSVSETEAYHFPTSQQIHEALKALKSKFLKEDK